MIGLLIGATLFLALVNGANDNFKGVATLAGSGVLSFRGALALATLSTLAGSLLSVALAGGLVRAFSAKGLVPDALLVPSFLAAVAAGAALTVLVATVLGMPVSTTHALLGGLVGAGLMRAGADLRLGLLVAAFALPLLASPLLSSALAAGLARGGGSAASRLGVTASTCVCVGTEWVPLSTLTDTPTARASLTARVDTDARCRVIYDGRMAGLSANAAATTGHVASATLVGLARGLNDTPKIVGLLVGGGAVAAQPAALLVGLAMAVGGLLGSGRVARVLASRLTPMTPGEGLAANLATSLLVVCASRFGVPVSTTHVATGGILGIGAQSGRLHWGPASAVLLAWLVTLPLAALLAGASAWLLA